jgi:hypothetical protein
MCLTMSNSSLTAKGASTASDPPHTGQGVHLHLIRPSIRTLVWALLILIVLLSLLEGLARFTADLDNVPLQSIGSSHRQFEIQVALLEKLIRQEGSVDCVFLGASGVHRAIDPLEFHKAFQAATGAQITCFNFGVSALNPATASVLAEIIAARYQPWLIIYGVDIPGFFESAGEEAEEHLLDVPWVQYQLGSPTIQGWLVDHSYALRYYLLVRNWMLTDFKTEILPDIHRGKRTDIYGFRPTTKEGIDVSKPPKPNEIRRYSREMHGYEISSKQLQGLERLLEIRSHTQIVTFEVPVHRTFMAFFESGEDDYLEKLVEIECVIRKADVPFWRTWKRLELPDELWLDRNHLKPAGAVVFSPWLADRIGSLIEQGVLLHP